MAKNTKNNVYIYMYTEKAMAPHSSTLAWKIPWTEEPGRLQSNTIYYSRFRTSLYKYKLVPSTIFAIQ